MLAIREHLQGHIFLRRHCALWFCVGGVAHQMTWGSQWICQGGTGLGLAIVKHILEAHQQSINVRSKVSTGSTFGFTLKKVNHM